MRFSLFIVAAALVPLALAAQAPATRAPQAPTPRLPAAAQPPDRSVIGTLDAVDLKTMQIVVAAASGRRTLHVPATVTIRQGSRTVKVTELPVHKGERVKVRYREAGGVQQAEWIVLASPESRPPRHTNGG